MGTRAPVTRRWASSTPRAARTSTVKVAGEHDGRGAGAGRGRSHPKTVGFSLHSGHNLETRAGSGCYLSQADS